MKKSDKLFKAKQPVIKQRCIHLDLKGVPPTPKRLIELLKIFAAARYNAVLVEWEDSFPWTVDKRFRSETAYSPAVVRQFVKTANDLGMELIPLVQCLGHMETPLRLPEYAALRETPFDEAVLNPLAPGARELVEKMVEDVLRLMPAVKHFHLGGDEDWTFGTHPDTKKYIEEHGKGALYLQHVEPLLDKFGKNNIRPMLWHDMMRDWDSFALKKLARKSDLVAWGYGEHPDTTKHHFARKIIERFVKHGVTLWGGTAYKGADGADADLPDIARRQDNAMAWTEVAGRYGFVGVIATAWSRYWTSACQNEPIDGALDSAFNVGVILHDGNPPRGGIEACRRELFRIGEGKTFGEARKALLEMKETQDNAWNGARLLHHLIITVSRDRRRLPAFFMVKYLKDVGKQIENAETASKNLRKSLRGLVDRVWVERYIAERIESLREEFSLLETRIRRLSPAAYKSMFEQGKN